MKANPLHFAPVAAILVVLAPALTVVAAAPSARAATALPSSTVPTAPTELSKVILPETSPTGPALWTIEGSPSSSTYNAVLAWTGTDPAHHVNVRTSGDGQHFGPKVTLGETAISRPAVAVSLSSQSFARILILAWTGTDTRHSLNVLFDVFNVTGHRSKRTLVDTSIAGPALVTDRFLAGERFRLAWTGTDPNHSLNVLDLDEVCTGSPPSCGNVIGLTLGPKRTLPSRLSSFAGPELTSDIFLDQDKVLLTWAQTASSQLGLADVSPSVAPPSFVFFSPQTADARPSLLALVLLQGGAPVEHF
jgi:hypothetical protein